MKEIEDEGRILSHCVGGYAERHAMGKLSIMFLRKVSEPDKPYYTVTETELIVQPGPTTTTTTTKATETTTRPTETTEPTTEQTEGPSDE